MTSINGLNLVNSENLFKKKVQKKVTNLKLFLRVLEITWTALFRNVFAQVSLHESWAFYPKNHLLSVAGKGVKAPSLPPAHPSSYANDPKKWQTLLLHCGTVYIHVIPVKPDTYSSRTSVACEMKGTLLRAWLGRIKTQYIFSSKRYSGLEKWCPRV